MTSDRSKVIKAIPVKQWLQNWDTFQYNPSVFRRKPKAHFYLFTMNARDLKALSGIQRRHEGQRSEEIGRFVLNGYPWSGFAKSARESGQFDDLRKPGWLPTAVVVNILEPKNKRKGQKIFAEDCIAVRDAAHGLAEIVLPDSFSSKNYKPRELYPIEVIDGQHRLWAFEENSTEGV